MVTYKGRSPRHISDTNTLEKYGATVILDEQDQPIGIQIAGWSITTSSSSIGNEGQMDELTSKLEEAVEGRRRISLPEIVYVNAFVSIQYNRDQQHLGESELALSTSSSCSRTEIRFSAQDALMEWASCHNHLPAMEITTEHVPVASSYKGVSIIKTVDAKLWEQRQAKEHRRKQGVIGEKDTAAVLGQDDIMTCSTEFNYDWTYSTPYTGTVRMEKEPSKDDLSWEEMDTSGLDLVLLSDQTQPILYFDDVHLYEDDMHDNGYVSLRCKIRVMPTCFLILLSLFVRVDHVLLRVKEVRLFTKFLPDVVDVDEKEQDGNDNIGQRRTRIYRDVTWRESSWDGLAVNGLPAHIGSWRIEDDVQGDASQQQRIQGMIRIIPQVELPMDIYRHCCLDVS
jgi:type 2A phosphatase activator TIP41